MNDGLIVGRSITNSPLNLSKSKQCYSFNRSERFDVKNKFINNAGQIYKLPEVLSKRATTLGIGERKSTFIKKDKANAPYYNLPSDFDQKKVHAHAYTFGIAREFYKKVLIEGQPATNGDNTNPGPADYKTGVPLGQEAPKFGLKGKGFAKADTLLTRTPGPGEYPVDIFNALGKYPKSCDKSAVQICFGMSKDKRFNYKNKDIPGPGQYDCAALINGQGTSFISKFKSSPSRSILNKFNTRSHSELNVPGPGSYKNFSEFSVFEPSKPMSPIGGSSNNSSQIMSAQNRNPDYKQIETKNTSGSPKEAKSPDDKDETYDNSLEQPMA